MTDLFITAIEFLLGAVTGCCIDRFVVMHRHEREKCDEYANGFCDGYTRRQTDEQRERNA